MTLDFSRPGKPTDKAFVESFNGRLCDECLNTHWFLSLADARAKIEAWRSDHKESRPRTALGWMTPLEYAASPGLTPADAGRKLSPRLEEKPGDRHMFGQLLPHYVLERIANNADAQELKKLALQRPFGP